MFKRHVAGVSRGHVRANVRVLSLLDMQKVPLKDNRINVKVFLLNELKVTNVTSCS